MADPHPEARDPGGNDAVESTGVQIQKRMTPEDFGVPWKQGLWLSKFNSSSSSLRC